MDKESKVPKGITGALVRLFIKNHEDVKNDEVRSAYGVLGGWLSVVVNLILAAVKFTLGSMINSRALIADAIHSLGDLLTSAVVIFGFFMSKKPRDQEHPFGHANAELVASLIMSVLLILAGVELLKNSIVDLLRFEFHQITVDWITIVLILLTIVVKEWLTLVSKALAKAIDSTALDADAWHHRLDSLTTLLVLIGVVASSRGIIWLDSAIGVVVSLVIIWSGIDFAKDSISPLLGENITPEEMKKIRELALRDSLVSNVHDILVHKYGRKYFVSLHAEISDDISSVRMHDIAAATSDRIMGEFGGSCVVHVDPINYGDVRYQEVSGILHELIEAKRELIEFHDLQFREKEGKEIIIWEFSVDPNVSEKKYGEIDREVKFYLQNIWKESELDFTLEPGYNVVLREKE